MFPEVVRVLEDAANNGQARVSIQDVNMFSNTPIDNAFVFQSYYAETVYVMTGMIRRMIEQRGDQRDQDDHVESAT